MKVGQKQLRSSQNINNGKISHSHKANCVNEYKMLPYTDTTKGNYFLTGSSATNLAILELKVTLPFPKCHNWPQGQTLDISGLDR